MPVLKYFGVVGAVLLMLFALSDGMFGEPASAHRFDPSVFDSAAYAPTVAAASVTGERSFSDDIMAADRVREVFDQFTFSRSKRGKRLASGSSAIW